MKARLPWSLIPWLPLVLMLVTVAIYIWTLDTGLRPDELTGGDLVTHQYAQVQGRPGNAPGYPLYTMLGWLWFRVGRAILGWAFNPVQVLSFYSTLWGLASLWLLFWLLYRPEVTARNPLLAALLTLFYAVTYFFWYYSVTTEQYTSAIFQTLLLVWLVFRWEAKPSDLTLWLMALVCGAMAANMLTALFILPPLLYLIFSKRPPILKNLKLILQTTLFGLLPLLSYAYIYVRGAQHPEWRGQGDWASTWDWFIHFLSTQQGRDELAPGLTLQNLITPEYPALIWGELTWPVLIGGLIGLGLMGRRMAIFFFGALGIYLIFVTGYRFGNWFQVILPVYPLLVVGFGRGAGWLWERYEQVWARGTIVILLLLLLGYRFGLSLPRADQSHLAGDTGLDPGWAVLADAEAGWTISPRFEEWVALQYLAEIWGAAPVVGLVQPGMPADFITRRAAEAHPNLLDETLYPQAIGATLIQRRAEPLATLPPPAAPLDLPFGDAIRLAGYEVQGEKGTILLYWTTLEPLAVNYTVSVRLWRNSRPIQAEAGPLIQDHQPVWNTYPTSRWQPDYLIADAYTFSLPPGVQPEQVHIVIYQATDGGFENLGDAVFDISWP